MAGPMDVHIASMVRCQEHVEAIKVKFESMMIDMEPEDKQYHADAIQAIRDLLNKPMGI